VTTASNPAGRVGGLLRDEYLLPLLLELKECIELFSKSGSDIYIFGFNDSNSWPLVGRPVSLGDR
jgi:hypothetical protein